MDIEQRKLRIKKFASVGLIALAALVVSPLIFFVIKGLVGLVLAAVIGLSIVTFTPVIAMKFANWRLQAIKAESRTNPIETLQNQYIEKRAALGKFLDSISAFSTEVKNFENKVEEFNRKFPNEAARFQEQLDAMKKLLEFRKSRFKQAKAELDQFDNAIQRAEAMWNMSQAAQEMNKLAGMQTGDPFEKIKQDAAIDSVYSSMNKAFADLETALLDTNEQPKLEFQQAQVIEVIPVQPKVQVRN